jgi:hypothetical protein
MWHAQYDMITIQYSKKCIKGGHEPICRSPGSVPVSHLDYFGLTQICGNTCAQVPEPTGQIPVMIQVPMSILSYPELYNYTIYTSHLTRFIGICTEMVSDQPYYSI